MILDAEYMVPGGVVFIIAAVGGVVASGDGVECDEVLRRTVRRCVCSHARVDTCVCLTQQEYG